MRLRSSALAWALLLTACAGVTEREDQSALVADGRAVAEAQCARCHAVGEFGESPRAEAPAFRTILTRYDAEALEEELIEGIQLNHTMPEFQFNPQGADALIAYLRSIQTSEASEPSEPAAVTEPS